MEYLEIRPPLAYDHYVTYFNLQECDQIRDDPAHGCISPVSLSLTVQMLSDIFRILFIRNNSLSSSHP